MEIIGNLIKSAIEIGSKFQNRKEAGEAQREILRSLLEKAKDTAFGKFYGFKTLLQAKDTVKAFQEEVPYHNYDQIAERWWHKAYEGKVDITWPGKVDYFAVSSGTTSNSKYIPVTEDMQESIRNGGIQQILSLSNFHGLPESFFEKEIMMLGSSTNLNEVGSHLEGEISGISASNMPNWFDSFYKPGAKISAIDDWDERVEEIAKNARNWDIGSLSGIPSWIELMLQRVIVYHGVDNIHDIWPNLAVYTSGGVALDPYIKSFNKLFGKPVQYIDTYLASEGYIATQVRPETDSMQLLYANGLFFEFVPFTTENMTEAGAISPDATALLIDEVEEAVDYVLVISSVTGAWRYMIGDTVLFTDKKRAEIKITGRTKFFLNVVGSQLSVTKMDDAISAINENFTINVKEFTVAAVKEGEDYIHHWYLGIADDFADISIEKLSEFLDQQLQENNKNYKVARTKALKGVKVNLVPATKFIEWNDANNKKGGQVKMPKVMKEKDFIEWEGFVKANN
jgi:hypothetical protein